MWGCVNVLVRDSSDEKILNTLLSFEMESVDSLTDLANALDVFFKGLSDCGLLATYSVQLQVTTVDFVLQIKFHWLVRQFIKSLQALLLKTSAPGHESSHDAAVQTSSDLNSVLIEVKQGESTKYAVPEQIGSLVEASIFKKSEHTIAWVESKEARSEIEGEHSATFVVQNSDNVASTDIIVTCHPAALAAIAGQSIITTTEQGTDEQNEEKLKLRSGDSFDARSAKTQGIVTAAKSEIHCELPVSCDASKSSDSCGENFLEIDENSELETVTVGEVTESTEQELSPLILKNYIDQDEGDPDCDTSVMHIVVSPPGSGKVCSVVKNDKEKKKPYECKDCSKTFTSTQSLDTHLSRKHTAKEQCNMCPMSFSSIQSLQEHCRLQHDGNGCFNCLLCHRRFMTKLSFKRHVDTHVGKKGAVCDMCGKSFSRADYLSKHYMTHNGMRPLSCSQCPRKFISSSHLKNHEKTHTGERAHICDVCHKPFSRADKLKEHMLRHLKIKRFQCSVCKRNYAEKRDLTKHLRVHEK